MNNSRGCAWFPPTNQCAYCGEKKGEDGDKDWRNTSIHKLCFNLKMNSLRMLKSLNENYITKF